MRDNSRQKTVKVVFLAYRGLESVLEPLSWQQRQSQTAVNGSRIVNSLVLSASLGEGRHIQLSEPVLMTFKHLVTENVSNPTCSFWDYTVNMWSEDGCRVTLTNRTHTLCECDHLTSFAVLADVRAAPAVDEEAAAEDCGVRGLRGGAALPLGHPPGAGAAARPTIRPHLHP